MPEDIPCPVCENLSRGTCFKRSSGRSTEYQCEACGTFEITDSVTDPDLDELSRVQRALLSHRIRTAVEEGVRPQITTYWLKQFKTESRLPSLALQAANLIRAIGDRVSETGFGYPIDPSTYAIVGAFDRRSFDRLHQELLGKGLIRQAERQSTKIGQVQTYDLTLDGWERYEAERRGQIAGKYGFIAMKFGDEALDPFVRDVVKPAVEKGIGYDLVDMRDVTRAGVIDNIMRAQIRDAAFVLVDLTHDNSGAYWEAGYAEGLDKPVIYICKKDKFDDAKTHFDTNHCTTVPWSLDDKETFRRELVATLRRSLNLFPE